MILISLLEFAGIALVLPFIRFAEGSYSINSLSQLLPESILKASHNQLLILGGLVIFLLILLSSILKLFLAWKEQKFVWDLSHRLSTKQHRNILSRPFSFFIEKNSAEIITDLIVETSATVRGVLLPIAQIISNGFVAILFLSLITILHPSVSFILFTVGVLIGLGLITILKNKLKRLGQRRLHLERSRFLQLKESVIGIKTVKSNAKELFFLDKFFKVSKDYSTIKPFVNTLNSVPKYAMDILLFGGVVLLIALMAFYGKDVNNVLPTLAFYVLVGFKLLPTFQNIINAVITIRFNYPSLQAVIKGMQNQEAFSLAATDETLNFNEAIHINKLSFGHIKSEPILTDISLSIKKGQKIGIVGYSGSGKTTLVEIICGLLQTDEGEIKVDNVLLDKQTIPAFQNLISFIPQDVFFFDDTILRNITFEDHDNDIDFDWLENVCNRLQVKDFIDQLPKGLQTQVGELGVKISGGQKQKIGFVRALYRNPEILILDESTSALDYISERQLLENVREGFPNLTIIKVAHRLKSVQDCDVIYFLENGKITGSGSFDQIISDNDLFREMVLAGTL